MPFQVWLDSTRVTIQWETATENSVAGFQVERSPDGLDFAALGRFVFAQGSVISGVQYDVHDDLPPRGGSVWYRLAERASDGKVRWHPAVALSQVPPSRPILLPLLAVMMP